jgi:FkbH-like protein
MIQSIEHEISQGNYQKAAHLLRQLWHEEQTVSCACYVANRADELAPHLHLVSHKVAFLRSFTIEPTIPILKAQAFLLGAYLDIFIRDFNTYAQDILDQDSRLYQFAPDTVILAVQTRDLIPQIWERYVDCDAKEVVNLVEIAISTIEKLVAAFRNESQANLVIHTFEYPTHPAMGILQDNKQLWAVWEMNAELREIARRTTGVYLLDYDHLVSCHGRLNWFSELRWESSRMPFSTDALLPMANEWLRFLLPLSGRIAKVLIMDLDNTLWDGVFGEDGIDGVKPNLPLQRAMLDISARGIPLAICSKNNPEAMEVFSRPDMLLREDDFSVVYINWDDKAENLRRIAGDLNVGIDSLAFLDDSPFERERVQMELPEVFVIDLPSHSTDYARTLYEYPPLERLALTKEDSERVQMYAAQKQRADLWREVGSLEDFYCSLETVLTFHSLSRQNVARIAQLTQKTNQFNLTTRRYTEQELLDMDAEVFGVSVRDRFGDNGIVGVVILYSAYDIGVCEIDTFLLSCRVIGRTVETGILSYLVSKLGGAGIQWLIGKYIPTRKNTPAKDFFQKHGFELVTSDTNGETWKLDTQLGVPMPEWLIVE